MKLIGLIARIAVAVVVLKLTACVERTTINAHTVTLTKPVTINARADVKGLPLPLSMQ